MIGTYAFDAYGTLFDVHSAVRGEAATLGAAGERLSQLWRTKQLEYTWVRSLAGRYRDFRALTEASLDYALAVAGVSRPGLRERLMAAYHRLDAYPEVAGVLGELKRRGMRVAILSNGTPAMLADAVTAAGIGDVVDDVISVDAAQVYKTSARTYDLLTARCGGAGTIRFHSSNRWDVAGAVAYGLPTTWINRMGQPDEYPDLPPAAIVATLAGILDLPDAG